MERVHPGEMAGGPAQTRREVREGTETPQRPEESAGTRDADLAALVIGVLGGTGEEGRGLARRLALAGHRVIVGSRKAERAEAAAAELGVEGGLNAEVAARADLVIVAVHGKGTVSCSRRWRESWPARSSWTA
jgi:glutamyl-tRNA reductase